MPCNDRVVSPISEHSVFSAELCLNLCHLSDICAYHTCKFCNLA